MPVAPANKPDWCFVAGKIVRVPDPARSEAAVCSPFMLGNVGAFYDQINTLVWSLYSPFRLPLIHHCLGHTLPATTTFNSINRSQTGLRRGEFGGLSEYRYPAGLYPEMYMH